MRLSALGKLRLSAFAQRNKAACLVQERQHHNGSPPVKIWVNDDLCSSEVKYEKLQTLPIQPSL